MTHLSTHLHSESTDFLSGTSIGECFLYLLLNHGWASLSGVLLGHLRGDSHLLLDLLLVLLLLLLLLLLSICRLLHVLQPELGQLVLGEGGAAHLALMSEGKVLALVRA